METDNHLILVNPTHTELLSTMVFSSPLGSVQVLASCYELLLSDETSSRGGQLLTMCPSLAATKHMRPPLKNEPFSEPKADSPAATDMIQPQFPNTLFLRKRFNILTETKNNFQHSKPPTAMRTCLTHLKQCSCFTKCKIMPLIFCNYQILIDNCQL